MLIDGKKWKSSGRAKGEKDASAPRLLMVSSRQGQSTTERGCFRYQVNARHPRAESLLKKTRKIAQLIEENKNLLWNLFGQNVEMIRRRIIK